MKKILNEWRKFLKENLEDDLEIGSIVLTAIELGNEKVPTMQKKLRMQKKRAIRVLEDLLSEPDALMTDVYDSDVITKDNLEVYFIIGVIGVPGFKYFESESEFLSRARMVLNKLKNSDFEIPNRIGLNFRDTRIPGPQEPHSGGPGDAGLAIPDVAFDQEDREELDTHISKWVDLHKATWSGDKNRYAKAAKEAIPAVEYFIGLYRRYMPLDSKYINALFDMKSRLINAKPPAPEKTPDLIDMAMQKIKQIQKQIKQKEEEKTGHQNKRDKKKIEIVKKEIQQLELELRAAEREKREIRRRMRGR